MSINNPENNQKAGINPEQMPPLEPTAEVPPVHSDKLNDPAYWNEKLEGKTARVPREHRDDKDQRSGLKKVIAGVAGTAVLAVGGFVGVKALGGGENPAPNPDQTSSSSGDDLKDLMGSDRGEAPDPEAKLKPLDQTIDMRFMPSILESDDVELPQPGSVEEEVVSYCKSIASAMSSEKPHLLDDFYANTGEAALKNDGELYAAYTEKVGQLLGKYPATERPLLALECSNITLVPEDWADGTHVATFSLKASLVDSKGQVYGSPWDSANILPDRRLTLRRDGFIVHSNGEQVNGLLVEFSELAGS